MSTFIYGTEDIDELRTEDTALGTIIVLSCPSALCRVKVGHQRARTLLSLTDILFINLNHTRQMGHRHISQCVSDFVHQEPSNAGALCSAFGVLGHIDGSIAIQNRVDGIDNFIHGIGTAFKDSICDD